MKRKSGSDVSVILGRGLRRKTWHQGKVKGVCAITYSNVNGMILADVILRLLTLFLSL